VILHILGVITCNSTLIVPVDPDENLTYELGIKADLMDSRARVNATAFFSDYQNYQFEWGVGNDLEAEAVP
jgi:outer membrane receptor protein involved in Fe transport